jgi:hypothetical protein
MLSALVVSAAGLAGAQGIENTPETVVFSVEGNARFDDNRDATRSGKESQVTLRFTPGARLNLDDNDTRFFLMYKPSGIWRDNTRDDQNETELYHLAEANVEHWASERLRLGAFNRFEMTDDPNVTAGGVTVRESTSYWLNQSKGWMAYALSERLQYDIDGSYLIKRYEDNDFEDAADENRLVVNTGLRYKLEPDLQTFGFVGYDRPTFESDARGDYHGYLAGGGVTRTFSDRLSGTVAAGYKLLEYSDADDDSEGLPFFQLIGEYRLTSNLRLQAQADYSLEPSDRAYYSSKEYSRLLLRGLYTITDSLIADAQVVFANGAYDASTATEEGEAVPDLEEGDDTLVDYQAGLTFRPKARRYYGRVAYEYEDWTSDVRESFARNTVSAMVGMEF